MARRLQLATADDLSNILDDLRYDLSKSPDGNGWYHNRSHIIEAYKRDAMHVVVETRPSKDATPIRVHYTECSKYFRDHTIRDEFDCTIPAFVVHYPDPSPYQDTILWVRPDFRRKGYGSFMVRTLNIVSIEPIPRSSVPFWLHLNFVPVGTPGGGTSRLRMDLLGATPIVDITGIDKSLLLHSLVCDNPCYRSTHLRDERGRDSPFDIDYHRGVAVKTNIALNFADPRRYDDPKYQHPSSFASVVASLRSRPPAEASNTVTTTTHPL